MKKWLFALMLCMVSIVSYSSTVTGYTTSTIVYDINFGRWLPLSNGAGVPVEITDKGISIKSAYPQFFTITQGTEPYYNLQGYLEIDASAIDQDGSICELNWVYRDDLGEVQLYIHYFNLSYMYSIVFVTNPNTVIH